MNHVPLLFEVMVGVNRPKAGSMRSSVIESAVEETLGVQPVPATMLKTPPPRPHAITVSCPAVVVKLTERFNPDPLLFAATSTALEVATPKYSKYVRHRSTLKPGQISSGDGPDSRSAPRARPRVRQLRGRLNLRWPARPACQAFTPFAPSRTGHSSRGSSVRLRAFRGRGAVYERPGSRGNTGARC